MRRSFVVVALRDMPGPVRDAFLEYRDHNVVNGVYVTFDNWQNTADGSVPAALVVERWLEEAVEELRGLRASGGQLEDGPVLVHCSW